MLVGYNIESEGYYDTATVLVSGIVSLDLIKERIDADSGGIIYGDLAVYIHDIREFRTISAYGTQPTDSGTTGTEPTGTESSGTDAEATASTENGISNIGTESVTITDTTVSDASTLITLNSNTTGVITASSVSEITGTASELNTLLTAGNDITQFLSLIHI